MLEVILYVLYGVLALVLMVVAWRLRFAYRHFKVRKLPASNGPVDDLPSVSVCIPARNERHAMTDCLEHVIKSDYPKLEVLVIDDMSSDETPTLIKSFAHEGVRFIEGEALPDGWLGKNHALQSLLDEASGTYVLFMDVDTRVQPDTVKQMVAYMQRENAEMLSVLPRREDKWRASVIFSTLRYFWELVFHHRGAPATASNAWMINRALLVKRWGGFSAFKSAIQPESRLSAELMAEHKYRFLIGTSQLGVSYEKKWRSQLATSIRLLYPLLGSNVSHVVVVALDLLVVTAPMAIVILSALLQLWNHLVIGAVLWILFAALYWSYTSRLWRHGSIIGALVWPLITLQELIILIVSTIRYKQRAVTWKGRLVRAPKH